MPESDERLHNRKQLKFIRRRLRNNATAAEAVLWGYLKKRQLGGRKFRRQHSIGPYVVDFYCPEERLALELDGAVHDDALRADYDAAREAYIQRQGIRIIRIENGLVFDHTEEVLSFIASRFAQ